MQAKDYQVVGWYHSHPVSEPKPSQNDILSQKKYQDAVPCVGIIVSKLNLTTLYQINTYCSDDPVPNTNHNTW